MFLWRATSWIASRSVCVNHQFRETPSKYGLCLEFIRAAQCEMYTKNIKRAEWKSSYSADARYSASYHLRALFWACACIIHDQKFSHMLEKCICRIVMVSARSSELISYIGKTALYWDSPLAAIDLREIIFLWFYHARLIFCWAIKVNSTAPK